MAKSIRDVNKDSIRRYDTKDNTFNDFPIGTRVKIITPCEDFMYFYGETGKVIHNKGKYLTITVEFDKPREFEDGTIQTEWNFNPDGLYILKNEKKVEEVEEMSEEDIIIAAEEHHRSTRFRLMDL